LLNSLDSAAAETRTYGDALEDERCIKIVRSTPGTIEMVAPAIM